MSQIMPMLFAALAVLAASFLMGGAIAEWLDAPERSAFITTVAGGASSLLALGCLLLQIGRPAQVLDLIARPTSALFIQCAGTTLAAFFALCYGMALWKGSDYRSTRFFTAAATAAAWAVVLSIGSGLIMSWRPAWNTWTLMLPLMGLSLVGAALSARVATADRPLPARTVTVAVAVSMLCTVSYLIALICSGNEAAKAVAQSVVFGDLAPAFWFAAVLGWGVPSAVIRIHAASVMWFVGAGLVAVAMAAASVRFILATAGLADWHFFIY